MPSKVEVGYERSKIGKRISLPNLIVQVKSYLYTRKKDYNDPEDNDAKIRADIWVAGAGKWGKYCVEYYPLCHINPETNMILSKDKTERIEAENINQVISMVMQSLEVE